MRRALALADAALGTTAPNPAVGCVLVRAGTIVGEGATQPGGRPHAEAVALALAGEAARGATAYVTLEPCAHEGGRGPACAHALAAAGIARLLIPLEDPDPRTAGHGLKRLAEAGVKVETGLLADEAAELNAGFFHRMRTGRPRVTLKLALSIDGAIALRSGESRWITGGEARAHAHAVRARSDLVVVGRGTLEADDPLLDVRVAGEEHRSPRPAVLSATLQQVPEGYRLAARAPLVLASPHEVDALALNDILVEGGAGAAAAFLTADRVDRLLVYRAPVLLGGRPALRDLGLTSLAQAHGRWRLDHTQPLGADRLETYTRIRS